MGADTAADLRVYRFEGGAAYEGGVLGAIERLELAADTTLLDALFVTRAGDGDELHAIDLAVGRADGTMAALLDFRLDPRSRPATTQRTLAPHDGGVPAAVVETVGTSLPLGGAVLAALVAGRVPAGLDDAVAGSGGRVVADTPVAARTLAEAVPQLCAAL